MATLYCKNCNGTGKLFVIGSTSPVETCSVCKGDGWIDEPANPRPDLAPDKILELQKLGQEVAREIGIPKDRQARKERPIARGVLDYFPDAIAEVAYVSFIGNEQHNPGQPMHWSKHLSPDEADALMRHLLERGKIDTDGTRHSAKVAWRALAMLQREIDAEKAK